MLVQHIQQPRIGTMFSEAPQAPDWRIAAIAAYREIERDQIAAMRHNLAARVQALTGFLIAPDSIHVDRDTHTATATLDHVRFRLHHGNLILLRPCTLCGLGEFESMPIEELADLGHALAVWEPSCAHCPVGDVDDATSYL